MDDAAAAVLQDALESDVVKILTIAGIAAQNAESLCVTAQLVQGARALIASGGADQASDESNFDQR